MDHAGIRLYLIDAMISYKLWCLNPCSHIHLINLLKTLHLSSNIIVKGSISFQYKEFFLSTSSAILEGNLPEKTTDKNGIYTGTFCESVLYEINRKIYLIRSSKIFIFYTKI